MQKLSIGIIGGSLAGCSAAILLRRAGHEVQVFERSSRKLTGRGGGIGTSGPVLNELVAGDIVDPDMPHLSIGQLPFIIRTPGHDRTGFSPLQVPADLQAFHWSTLWENLRKRVPDDRYHIGHEVTDARSHTDHVALSFRNGSSLPFDLALFADGYQSLGRKLLFPEHGLQYRGYMLWRGLLPESEMPDSEPLENQVARLWYPGLDGNLVLYFIPGFDGRTDKGHRLYNWAAYIPLPAEDLERFMVGRDNAPYSGSIPPGQMRLEEEARLKDLMRSQLPSYYAGIVDKTRDTYVQLIYTSSLPAYGRGRIGLIGDAGMLVQPFTGSGIFKGYNNARDLVEALEHHDNLEDAMAHWSQDQVSIGNHLMTYGGQTEKAFIFRSFDLATATPETAAAWWKAAVTPPKEFSIIR